MVTNLACKYGYRKKFTIVTSPYNVTIGCFDTSAILHQCHFIREALTVPRLEWPCEQPTNDPRPRDTRKNGDDNNMGK